LPRAFFGVRNFAAVFQADLWCRFTLTTSSHANPLDKTVAKFKCHRKAALPRAFSGVRNYTAFFFGSTSRFAFCIRFTYFNNIYMRNLLGRNCLKLISTTRQRCQACFRGCIF
jgi:hypothetical protein